MSVYLNRFACVTLILLAGLIVPVSVAAQSYTHTELIVDAMRGLLDAEANLLNEPALDRQKLREFYAPRDYVPVWVDGFGPRSNAEVLRQVLEAADNEGLDRDRYWTTLIALRWEAKTSTALARLELLLTDALMHYGLHQRAGRLTPAEVDPLWQIATPQVDAVELFETVLSADDLNTALLALPPPHPGYKRLRAALSRYRQLANDGGWPEIPPGANLRFGITDRRVETLRQRLMAEGDLVLGPVENVRFFDQAVKHAVERFQVRHGLKMDGVVGRGTRATMNVPVTDRIEQIRLNMERWRWLPRHLGRRYVMVNTAGFDLTAVEDGQTRFTMWVIIGKRDRPTPTLTGKMHTVAFNPYWTVPVNLAFKDVIPKQKRNPNFMKSRNIRVYAKDGERNPRDVEWARLDPEHFPYVLRQDPGPQNPLGRVKFLFSNNFEIYLHDTPKRRLFDREERTFSSGCIRVENPVQLAAFLLDAENGWSATEIRQTMAAGKPRETRVSETTRVYLVYWTAWVGVDSAVFFRPDVYQRDELLSQISPAPHLSHAHARLKNRPIGR